MNHERCPLCGRTAFIDIAELFYETREFVLDSCCAANLEGWIDDMRTWTRKQWVEWIFRKTGLIIRNVVLEDGVFSWQLDYGLEIRDIDWQTAKAFIAQFHEHSIAPQGWRFGGAVYNGRDLIGVVTIGRPVAAALQRQGCVEITRVCVNRSLPRGLVWNACSMAYGWACREIQKRLPQRRVITYTLLDEPGTSLKAAGFEIKAKTKGGSWHRKGRPRTDKATTAPKWRWERLLTKPTPSPGTIAGSLQHIHDIRSAFRQPHAA